MLVSEEEEGELKAIDHKLGRLGSSLSRAGGEDSSCSDVILVFLCGAGLLRIQAGNEADLVLNLQILHFSSFKN